MSARLASCSLAFLVVLAFGCASPRPPAEDPPEPRSPAIDEVVAEAASGERAAPPEREAPSAPAAQNIAPPDDAGVEVINAFVEALLVDDADASARAVLPYVHKSLKTRDGTALSPDTRQFSFKKAHANAGFYAWPVRVTRVQRLKTTEIGHPSDGSYEQGYELKYFIAKKPGVNGVPAPLTVFFPNEGGAPTVSYMGSL